MSEIWKKPAHQPPVANMTKGMVLAHLERLLIQGVDNDDDLVKALSISAVTLKDYKWKIYKKWEDEQKELRLDVARRKRIKNLEGIAQMSMEAFLESKEDVKEHTIQSKNCEVCYGTGIMPGGMAVPAKVREEVFDRDDYKCVLCTSESNLTLDHIIPRSKGGSNQASNLRVLCFSCNRIKSNKLPADMKCIDCVGEGEEEFKPGQFRQCLTCDGSGAKPDIPKCVVCQGSGKIRLVTVKTKGSVGDPAFLNSARSAFLECAKLEGLVQAATSIKKTVVEENVGIDGEVTRITHEVSYNDAPPDVLIRALAALDELEKRSTKGTVIVASTQSVQVVEQNDLGELEENR